MGKAGVTKNKKFICKGCNKEFDSKNALFRHLRSEVRTGKSSCLSPTEYKDFLRYVVNREENLDKIAVLYGYIPCDHQLQRGLRVDTVESNGDAEELASGIQGGNHAAQLVLEAIQYINLNDSAETDSNTNNIDGGEITNSVSLKKIKCNRSFGCTARSTDIVAQDTGTGALTEILCARAPPLCLGNTTDVSDNDEVVAAEEAMHVWIDRVNEILQHKISQFLTPLHKNGLSSLGKVKVFGRITVPKKFNAEMDANHRRLDYLIPADFLFEEDVEQNGNGNFNNRGEFFDSLSSFMPTDPNKPREDRTSEFKKAEASEFDKSILPFLHRLKKTMQRFCTRVIELDPKDKESVLAKEFNNKKRIRQRKGASNEQRKQRNGIVSATEDDKIEANKQEKGAMCSNTSESTKTKDKKKGKKGSKVNVLKRRRFHNFTPTVMAHEFLAYRRLDRFYHRATVRLDDFKSREENCQLLMLRNRDRESRSRPYLLLSLTGDLFLNGQARAVIGLFIALIRGYIHEDILDCMFDENYTNLVPAPRVPATGLYAGETNYMAWEGKMKAILSARHADRYKNGLNTKKIMKEVHEFQEEIQTCIIRAWDMDENGKFERLESELQWVTKYLEPWSKNANKHLADYRKWKTARDLATQSYNKLTIAESLLPPLESIKSDVPTKFQKVLFYLRQANSSGLWPSTTPKRQLVMVSTAEDSKNPDATPTGLSVARLKAQSNLISSLSAYVYKEGEGGASGSFSVGAMPGNRCEQPKGNNLFPELMKAAFDLEKELCPDRPPSSTIAINRNAQFRPHVDSGAGAGQSLSLIVGLGTYVGGELMVEGEKHCIRYGSLQFNGWKERHWTLPFRGERFSLVWFTPKGCEGIRGIDLYS